MQPIWHRLPGLQSDLIRFCVIGGVGFVVDATLLIVLTHLLHAGAVPARLLSFSVAVVVTFELNKRWTFSAHRANAYLTQLVRYIGVQSIGLLCNLTVYIAVCWLLEPTALNTLLALAIASASALLINYLGAKKYVFAFRPQPHSAMPDPDLD